MDERSKERLNVRETLEKQLQLLLERSQEKNEPKELAEMTFAMISIVEQIRTLDAVNYVPFGKSARAE